LQSAETKKQTRLLPDVDTVGSGMRLVLRCPGQRLQSDRFNFPVVCDPELSGDLRVTSLTNEWAIQHIGSPQVISESMFAHAARNSTLKVRLAAVAHAALRDLPGRASSSLKPTRAAQQRLTEAGEPYSLT
jgi:hypothetical protein